VTTFRSNEDDARVFLAVTGDRPADGSDSPVEAVLLTAEAARVIGTALVEIAGAIDDAAWGESFRGLFETGAGEPMTRYADEVGADVSTVEPFRWDDETSDAEYDTGDTADLLPNERA
jgi:hypothetical protein